MDGNVLANSLVSLKGTDLRLVYALLLKTNIGNLVSSKTKDVVSKFSKEEIDHFTKHLESEVRDLREVEDHVLQVDLFLEMTRILNLRGTKYLLEKEVVEQSESIINEVHKELASKDKNFKRFIEKETDSTMLQQLIKYQMSKVFRELDDSFNDLDIKDQTQFAAQVNEFLHSLPEHKQEKIKDKLGINDLTDDVLRKTIATSGTSIVFAIIVEISGFAFYTTATSLVASFAGIFGLTLPFGVYTGLTSTIAIFANPLFLIPLLLGGGALFINHQNKSLKKKLLPIIVMQITLPYMNNQTENVSFEMFLEEWNSRYKVYQNMHSQLEAEISSKKNIEEEVKGLKSEVQEINNRIIREVRQIKTDKDKMIKKLKASNLNDVQVNDAFEFNKQEYLRINKRINELNKNATEDNKNNSFFKKMEGKVSGLSTSINIISEEKKANHCLNRMIEDILQSNHSFMEHEREVIKELNKKISELKQLKEEKLKYIEHLENMLKQNQTNQIKRSIKDLEKQNYGLEHLIVTS